jgi:endoribonuclease LACTB2
LLGGAEPALIDAGVGDPAHLDAIAVALAGASLVRVIVTHAHSDHASGAGTIAARWPSARFLKMPWPERDGRYAVPWDAVAQGERVRAGDTALEVIHTPGHAPDHVALWHADSRTLFCGDLAARGTTVVIPGGRGGSVSEYLRSLERVLALEPAVLLPSHGPEIRGRDIERILRGYINHRHERERQVLDLLRERPMTADALVAEMYPTVHPKLAGAARDSVVAHLLKLQEEKRITVMPRSPSSVADETDEPSPETWALSAGPSA